MSRIPEIMAEDIALSVSRALEEDIGSGDISAQLIDATPWQQALLYLEKKP